jgi:RNA polymerase sigma factor (sigma-70 family)
MEIVDARDSDDVQAYRVKVIVRNNLLLTAIEEAGYKSVASFARAIGYTEQQLGNLISLRKPPINKNGMFSPLAKDIMEVLGAAPHDLWTTEQLTMNLHKNSIERVANTKFLLDTNAMQSILGGNVLQLEGNTYEDVETPDQNKTKKELASRIEESLDSLPMRHAKILRMRFGIGTDKEHTLEEVAEKYGVGKERIRQIEAKAMRLMRQPGRAKKIIDFLGED